ncbi:MAG: NINE protein [Gemmatimonadetes bacterium]|nr:NINE protein [Gemmatimonadota bacterium]
MKDKNTAYILWAASFVGVCGLQRIYVGKLGTGLLYLFTLGLFGVGQFIDLFLIPGMVEDANNRLLVQGLGQQALMAGGAGAAGALSAGRRAPRTTEEFQVALVEAAEKNGGRLTVAEAVSATGRGFKEVQRQLNEMAVNGFVETDSDEQGNMYYRFPGLERSDT